MMVRRTNETQRHASWSSFQLSYFIPIAHTYQLTCWGNDFCQNINVHEIKIVEPSQSSCDWCGSVCAATLYILLPVLAHYSYWRRGFTLSLYMTSHVHFCFRGQGVTPGDQKLMHDYHHSHNLGACGGGLLGLWDCFLGTDTDYRACEAKIAHTCMYENDGWILTMTWNHSYNDTQNVSS